MVSSEQSNWEVEIWARDEDFRLPRDDRARERVKVTQVMAGSREEAARLALLDREVRRRWPTANAVAYPLRAPK